MDYSKEQKIICDKFNTDFIETPSFLKVGISMNVKEGLQPLNGLRLLPEGDTSGWYIWAGETLSDDPTFFKPIHIVHLTDWCPDIIKYLALPPGYRFLTSLNYEDVWEDVNLLTK